MQAGIRSALATVPNSVMPKGVEHMPPRLSHSAAQSPVPNSVMPKGVEHRHRGIGHMTAASWCRIQ